ncbi:caffeoylshikimate esterase-like [Durio zibethinus]|uniref:Caffeoylshikimate esterase-like n=1 Tax=Durio zibethinus TaxID=66656 RepID=A0A6P5XBL7_DURZI|nr:caffeoylshikimate esterase-like [Durio zibethinus]
MELSLTFRSRSPFLPPKRNSSSTHPPKLSIPIISPTPALQLQGTHRLTVEAAARKKKKKKIEGVSEELNSIVSLNLDYASARRRVRSAFMEVQQQLDHCLFKMAPPGVITDEWIERNSKVLEIFFRSWMPEPRMKIKGAVCFCHGYGDSCTFFFEGIARFIAASGYGVYAIDHPGFGLSGELQLKYIPTLVGVIRHPSTGPTTGSTDSTSDFSHSVFGTFCFDINFVAAKIEDDVTPSEPVLKFLTLLAKVMPTAKLVPQKDLAELMFREPRKQKMAVYNVISYDDRVRLRTAVELLKATKEIEMQMEKVSSPLLILHGAADNVTDPLVSQFLYENASSKDKTLKLYEEGYHCILEGEPDDRIYTVLNDIIEWLDARC